MSFLKNAIYSLIGSQPEPAISYEYKHEPEEEYQKTIVIRLPGFWLLNSRYSINRFEKNVRLRYSIMKREAKAFHNEERSKGDELPQWN